MTNSVNKLLTNQKRQDLLGFRAGDLVKVFQEIEEGDKKRIQSFEGLVIARKHGDETGATFTVRRVISGIGVEKIFPLYSPSIKKIEIVKKPKRVSKAKLYWVRKKTEKEIQKRLRLEQGSGKKTGNNKVKPEGISKEKDREGTKDVVTDTKK
ncbi:MAG: 50S ribosomal protein L19 [Candidatus Paceibacterota bacterium]|jgi:large subunit ribosomal protein L19